LERSFKERDLPVPSYPFIVLDNTRLKLPNIVFTNYIGIAAASSQNTKSA
jgi:hypothetical protein